MQALQFKPYAFRFRKRENQISIFCETRRRFLLLTPEEWVRQHVVRFLLEEKRYARSLLNVERSLKVNGISKRYDVVVYEPDGSIFLLVECKAPNVNIDQAVFDQIARYNMALNARYLMVTNGLQHFYCRLDYEAKRYVFLREIPDKGNAGKNQHQ